MMNRQEKIHQLQKELTEFNTLYRLGTPQITDAEYDRKVESLKRLDPNNSWFQQAEPAPVNANRKRSLPMPMKSLNKVKSLADIQQWLRSLAIPECAELVVMPKYDGVSWLVDEQHNIAYSRGGAENEGQDCSDHFCVGDFKSLLKPSVFYNEANKAIAPMPYQYTFGELLFSCKNWEEHFAGQISRYTGDKYKSPRNTVAGLINRDEPDRRLIFTSFVRYGIGDQDLNAYSRYSQILSDLSKTYFQDNLSVVMTVKELDETKLAELFKEWRKIFYIDGLVIYLNDLNLWKTIGRQQTSGNPLYAIAYKHPDFTESFETKVKNISYQISKSGALKPVVNIDAVDTGDCTMENPTGYNAGWLRDHNIGIGSQILVTRSGDVIPKILEATIPVAYLPPERCPECDSPVEFDDRGIELCCTNPNCPGRQLSKIIHFFETVGVENMGDETFAKLFDAGHKSIKSILSLYPNDILKIEGFGESMVDTILTNNRKIKDGVDLATLMQASDCFKGIGKIKAQKILESLSTTLFDFFTRGKVEALVNQPEFASPSITIQSFLDGIKPFHEFMVETGVTFIVPAKDLVIQGKYTGFSVCFSGVRDKDLEHEIIRLGGKIASGISKTTTHLVVKDPNGTSSKISKARQLGVPILTIEQFSNL